MGTFKEAVGSAVKTAVCTALQSSPNAVALLRRVGLEDNPLRRTVNEFRRVLCSNPNPITIPPSGGPGGRCTTDYVVTYGYSGFSNFLGRIETVEGVNSQVPGPVGGIRAQIGPGGSGLDVFIVGSDGDIARLGVGGSWSPPVEAHISSVRRADNLPDNCGDRPSDNDKEPTPIVINTDISYTDNSNNSVTENGAIKIFAPILNLNGELSFPININLGGVDLTGELNLNGDFTFSPTFDFPVGDEDPTKIPPGIGPRPPAKMRKVIIGAKVYVKSNNGFKVGTIQQGENPNILIPRAGSIQFLVSAGKGAAWTEDIDVKTAVAWIPCPPPGIAVQVAGTPAIGVTWEINPVYRTVPA
jgi:hypothetical protein